MAYISAEEVKVIRNTLKATFPISSGWKFSVRGRDHSSVTVTVLQAPIFMLADEDFDITNVDVNQYYIEDHFTGDVKTVLLMIKSIITRTHWDKSDIQTDYFNCAFYYNMKIGTWEKEFNFAPNKSWNLKSTEESLKIESAQYALENS